MRIGIDARFLGPEGTGIGRYTEKLLDNLQKIDKNNQYFIFLRKNNFDLLKVTNNNFCKVLADARWYTLKEQFLMPGIIRKTRVDLMHFCHFNIPFFYHGEFVVTIHDLIKSEFASKSATTRNFFIYTLKHWAYRFTMSRAIKKATAVIVPTNYVKKKIEQLYHRREGVHVTYEAADNDFSGEISDPERILKKYNVRKPFILYVGNSYPYKNLGRLLLALKLLPNNISLVNPCARSVFYERLADKVNELGLKERVVLPGYVPDEDLKVLYKSAEVYVFPSLSEGFGIPPLAAMTAGLPVVCSKASCLPEVCEEAAVYFDPYNVQEMAQKIKEVLENPDQRAGLVKKGFIQAKKYSWQRMAEQTLEVYRG